MATNEAKKKNRLPLFQSRFSELRGDKSQDEFASFLEISRPTVGFYENGERLPDALVLKKIAEKCEVSSDWLLGLSDMRSPEIDKQSINKITGLSENAIKNLQFINKKSREDTDIWGDAMNFLIGEKHFVKLVHALFASKITKLLIAMTDIGNTANEMAIAKGVLKRKNRNELDLRNIKKGEFAEEYKIEVSTEDAEAIAIFKVSKIAESIAKEYMKGDSEDGNSETTDK